MPRIPSADRVGPTLLLILAALAGPLLFAVSGANRFAGDLLDARPARADDLELTEEEEERLEAIERHTEKGWKAFRSGNYEEVLARMQRLERYDPDHALPPYLRGRVQAVQGAYEDALTTATAAVASHPDDRGLLALRWELLLELGRVDEAQAAARARLARAEGDVAAHCVLGLALEERGRREEALEQYEAVVAGYSRRDTPAADLPWVARAAIRITKVSPRPEDDLLPDVSKLLSRYHDDHPDDLDVLRMIADLYQQDRGPRGQALASKYYRQLLDANPEIPEGRVGLARYLLVFYQQSRAITELERALRTNPNCVPALALLAAIHVGNGEYEKAEQMLERAKQVNPHDKETLSVEAALRWIRGDAEAFARLEEQVLAWDPTYGRLYVTVSELVGERQRRYDVAATFAEKAVATDPNDALGYVTLGEALMNLGRTEEAREHLQTAVAKSKRYKDVRRDNWLKVLAALEDWKSDATERFVVRYHASEARVMRHYLPPLLDEAWTTLSAKYGYTPEGPVRVDSFHIAEDFSVRSVGVPGLPALGVCFGEVITVLGPTSRGVGSFSWARTTWHEFAHTITLGLSKGQVPRWLTEGLSVYEEKARRDIWGRDMQRQLFDRYHNDRLLRMAKINRAFRGSDIMFAYYQGGLISEHLTESRGFEVIPRMLAAFAEDRTTAQVFDQVLGIDLAAYDGQFREFVGRLVADYKLVPRWDDESLRAFQQRVKDDPEDAEAWTRLGWAHLQRGRSIDAGGALAEARRRAPGAPEVILLEGRLAQANRRADLARAAYERFLAAGGDDLGVRMFLAGQELGPGGDSARAVEHLEAAKRCFPYVLGESSPYLQLAELHRGAGDVAAAIAELEAYAQVAGEDYGVRSQLKAWYRRLEDHERVARLCEEMITITPFGAPRGKEPDLELHRDYATALLALDRREEAGRELAVQVEILGSLPEERRLEAGAVGDHVRLGEYCLAEERPFDALEQAVAALRLAPDDADARMLKSRAEEAAGYR